MKAFCGVCMIHFKDEFDNTLKAPCNYWGDLGMGNLENDLKRKLWDWLFLLPSDEIGLKSGIGVAISLQGVPIEDGDKFENLIPGYKDLSEEQRKQAQRDWFNTQKKIMNENIAKEQVSTKVSTIKEKRTVN